MDNFQSPPMVIVLMGVTGSGKSTVGNRLAEILQWDYFDGDDFHPEENIAKLSQGIALTDRDRMPWLTRLHDLIAERLRSGQAAILACSALKKSYRDLLLQGNPGTTIVYLRGDYDLILKRLQGRQNHFMNPVLLNSQYEILEEPADTLTIDVSKDIDILVTSIIKSLSLWNELA